MPTMEQIAEVLQMLGFDDAKAVVITPTSAVAISADYPEPPNPPEVPNGQ